MVYKFNGKNIRIDDKQLDKLMKSLDLTKEEAIQMYLEDEGYLDNEEQLELDKKAKESGIMRTIHDAKDIEKEKKKTTKPKTVKVSDEKQHLFRNLKGFLEGYALNVEGNVEILKENKLIQVQIGEKIFKIDLIEQRPKKDK